MRLNDREYATLIEAASYARDELGKQGFSVVETAAVIEKMQSGYLPTSDGIEFEVVHAYVHDSERDSE